MHVVPSKPERPRPSPLVSALQRAVASAEAAPFADLYAEDAVLEEVSTLSPPAHPLVVVGREAIRQHVERQILHDPVSGWARHLASGAVFEPIEVPGGIAFAEKRTYAAGDTMIAHHLARTDNDRITHDRVVVVWDAAT